MASLLRDILSAKRREVTAREKKVSLRQLQEQARLSRRRCRNFVVSLGAGNAPGIIGELKRASPVKGWLNRRLDIAHTARLYQRHGVRALSVLTDRHFKGTLADIAVAKAACRLPVLRKDFIINEYQVYESYVAGADAILLIAAALSRRQMSSLAVTARELGMATLAEVHTLREAQQVIDAGVDLVGINNRNLRTFQVNIKVTARLMPRIPKNIKVVSESGIRTQQDVRYVRQLGVFAVLVGESIVTAPDMAKKLRELTGKQ